jgi:hypothetical protein
MKYKVLLLITIIFIILTSCSPDTSINKISPDNIEIPSLKEYYEILVAEARKWSPDAYLREVDIPIGKKDWAMSADFYSPTNDKQSLTVIVSIESNLSSRIFGYTVNVPQSKPVLFSDWKIDSQDALEILMHEHTDYFASVSNPCGSIKLSRMSYLPDNPLLWVLSYYECGSPTSNYLYLDATSGVVIEINP